MKYVSLFFLCFTFLFAEAQSKIEVDMLWGRIWKHKKGLLYKTPPISFSTGIHLQKKTSGLKAWHRYWGKPELEIISNFQIFGNNEVLGTAVSIAPGIIFRLKEWKSATLHFHYATGISYLNKRYNRIDNFTNNAIGSNLNNTTRLKLSIVKKINQEWSYRLGLSFVHFSNGGTTKPNSGINVYGINVGIIRALSRKEIKTEEFPLLKPRKKWGMNVQGGIGKSEYDLIGGPNYPVYALSLGGYYRHKDFQRVHFGLEYEYSVATAEFERATLRPELANEKARRSIIYVANELLFGEIHLRFQLGYYTQVFSSYEGKPVYFKFQSSYHPSFLRRSSVRPYVGIMLKTHYAVAEYIALNLGIDI